MIHSGSYSQVVDESKPIDTVPRWFDGIELSFVENLLWSRSASDPSDYHGIVGKEDDKIAITEVREGVTEIREVTWGTLRNLTMEYASALQAGGVGRGDRVVVVGANSIDTLVIWAATSWLGAVFSSNSTDMGVQAILQRTLQINPRVRL